MTESLDSLTVAPLPTPVPPTVIRFAETPSDGASATQLFLPQSWVSRLTTDAQAQPPAPRFHKFHRKSRKLTFRQGRAGMVILVTSRRGRPIKLFTVQHAGKFSIPLSRHQAHRLRRDGGRFSFRMLASPAVQEQL